MNTTIIENMPGTGQRLEGDGMDHDVLIPDYSSTLPPPRRHQHLMTPLKSTSVAKETASKFIPHEPVKGAVKPLISSLSRMTSPKTDSRKLSPPRRDSHQEEEPVTERLCDVKQEETKEVREVEGESSSRSDAEKLIGQVKSLENELEVQLKVNGDLKKLLVASVGDDLHHKVESLVRTKAHLASEIGDYAQKVTLDCENLDHLSIEADKWRSKYMASKMLLESTSHERDYLRSQLPVTVDALRVLMQERNTLKDSLIHTHRYLKLVRDSFDPQASRQPVAPIKDSLHLARTNEKLGEAVKFRLLGSMPVLAAALDYGIEDGFTPAESNALQVIAQSDVDRSQEQVAPSVPSHFSRFHPRVRYENITFNCCASCKGDIHVV